MFLEEEVNVFGCGMPQEVTCILPTWSGFLHPMERMLPLCWVASPVASRKATSVEACGIWWMSEQGGGHPHPSSFPSLPALSL